MSSGQSLPHSRKDTSRTRRIPLTVVLDAQSSTHRSPDYPRKGPRVVSRQPVARVDHLSPLEASLRQSRTLGVCFVNTGGQIVDANDCFYELLGADRETSGLLSVDTCFSPELANPSQMPVGHVAAGYVLRSGGQTVPAVIEVLMPTDGQGQMWLVLPRESGNGQTPTLAADSEISPAQLFECVHSGVAQSIAALAMNLHLVSLHDELPTSANARQLLQASVALVDQCSREVRSLSRLLRAAPPMSDSSRA